MKPYLDIIIVNWNSGSLLSECVDSIKNTTVENFIIDKITIVDNSSTDDSLKKIDKGILPIEIIKNETNLGFAKACNQAAANSHADFFLFLNPDTRLHKYTLETTFQFIQNELNSNIGIIGVQLVSEENAVAKSCARFPTPLSIIYSSLGLDYLLPKIFPNHFMIEWDHSISKIVDQVMGAFFLVRKSLFNILKGFDERFFVYYEDIDLAYRANSIGYKSYYLSNAQVYHKGGGTSEQVKANRLFYLLRSKLFYCKKHFSHSSYFVILLVTHVFEPIARIIGTIFKGKVSDTKEILKAYIKLFMNDIIISK